MNKLLFIVNVDWYFILHWVARAKAAKSQGYEVYIATTVTESENVKRLEDEGFKVIDLNINRKSLNPLSNLKSLVQIYRCILQLKPQLVHSITVKPNVFSGLICRFLHIPQIMSVTGLGITFSSHSYKARLSRKIVLALYQFSAKKKAVRIVFENNEDKTLFLNNKIASDSKLKVIKGAGIDTDEYGYIEEVDYEIPRVLFAARMLWDKGIKQLIDAAEILRLDGYLFELNVAGIIDTQSSAAIPEKELIKWDDEKKMKWLGRRYDMPNLIAESNIICLPTTYGEGVPRILIEACSIGRTVITTNVSGCNEIVQHNRTGLLVEPNNTDELADALRKLLTDYQLRNKFGINARKLVLDQYSEENVIAETLAMYQEVLS